MNSKINKRSIIGWCLYDFANSTYSAVIVSVVFSVYYTSFVVTDGTGDLWWGRAISLSMLIVAIISPVLGGIADYTGLRKRFMGIFTLMSVIAIAMLAFVDKGMVIEGAVLILIANIGMEGGLVFYNSYLPHLAPPAYHGRVSSWGFAVGYAGSVLSLVIALPLVKGGHYDLTWLMVAALFAVFSLPAFIMLEPDKKRAGIIRSSVKSIKYTFETLRTMMRNKETRRFFAGYFLYADGVSTIIVFSSVFAARTLGFKTQELILLYIMVQISALIGATLMAKPTDTWGPRRVVLISLYFWAAICLGSYFVQTKQAYWGIAITAGLCLGTVQAAGRALFARLVPDGSEAEYFGVYAFAGKSSAVLGPLMFGYVSTIMGSQRPAVLSVALFFIGGIVFISGLRAGEPLQRKQV